MYEETWRQGWEWPALQYWHRLAQSVRDSRDMRVRGVYEADIENSSGSIRPSGYCSKLERIMAAIVASLVSPPAAVDYRVITGNTL